MALDTSFTRRRLLIGSAATLALPGFGLAAGVDKEPASPQTKGRSLRMLSGNHPEFKKICDSLYPRLTSDPRFAPIAPLAILMTLESGPPIRAYSAAWSVQTQSDTYATALFRCAPPGAKRRGRKGTTLVSGQTDVLRSGETRLITPFFILSPKRYRILQDDWRHLVTRTEPGQFLLAQISKNALTYSTIDAVIFGDRTILGEDKHKLAAKLIARRNGEHDEARAVVSLLKSGASLNDVAAMLAAHATGELPAAKGVKRSYLLARRNYARFVHDSLLPLPRESFEASVTRASRLKRTRLKTITL